MAIEVDLLFAATDCDACGAEFPVAIGCVTCGATEPRDDPYVTARRDLIDTARQQLRDGETFSARSTPEQLIRELRSADVVDNQLKLLSAIDDPDDQWSARYGDNLRRFRAIRERVLISTGRRDVTLASAWVTLDEIVMRAASAIDGWERAATASTPESSRGLAAQAQRHINALEP
jgi:hypothetical protein